MVVRVMAPDFGAGAWPLLLTRTGEGAVAGSGEEPAHAIATAHEIIQPKDLFMVVPLVSGLCGWSTQDLPGWALQSSRPVILSRPDVSAQVHALQDPLKTRVGPQGIENTICCGRKVCQQRNVV